MVGTLGLRRSRLWDRQLPSSQYCRTGKDRPDRTGVRIHPDHREQRPHSSRGASDPAPRTDTRPVNRSAAHPGARNLIDTILAPLRRPTVIELSEHELITDYKPIATAMQRLGPHRSLAV